MSPAYLAAIHAGGSTNAKNKANRIFGGKVNRLINMSRFAIIIMHAFTINFITTFVGAKPNDTSQVCRPKCRLGQCCVNGKCLCVDPSTLKLHNCECMLDYL